MFFSGGVKSRLSHQLSGSDVIGIQPLPGLHSALNSAAGSKPEETSANAAVEPESMNTHEKVHKMISHGSNQSLLELIKSGQLMYVPMRLEKLILSLFIIIS